jgi:monofunctional biosynthetic peptidoglycan transglycosylase
VAAACLAFLTGCNMWGIPDPSVLKTAYPVVREIRNPDGTKKSVIDLKPHRPASWVELGAVSRAAVSAIIVSEDWAFYSHKGYDPKQIKEALSKDLDEGHFARGASTITQQVARNVFLSQEKTLWRKVKELALAIKMEHKLNKRKILEVYLNIAEWGDGTFGIGPAARLYFSKSPSELTAKEGAFLAMLLPSPKKYSISFRKHRLTEYAHDTVETILDKMQQAHFLTVDQKMDELELPLSFEVPEPGEALPEPEPSHTGPPPEDELESDPDPSPTPMGYGL